MLCRACELTAKRLAPSFGFTSIRLTIALSTKVHVCQKIRNAPNFELSLCAHQRWRIAALLALLKLHFLCGYPSQAEHSFGNLRLRDGVLLAENNFSKTVQTQHPSRAAESSLIQLSEYFKGQYVYA